jgi:hypothetical protein
VVRETLRAVDATPEPPLSAWEWRLVAGVPGGAAILDSNPAPFRRLAVRHLVAPADADALTDREKACYILGRIQGYSHLGTHIEAVVDHIEPDEIADRIVENYDDPKGFFSTPSGDDDPEFNNGEPW